MAQERNLSIRQSMAVTFCTEVIDGDQVLPIPQITVSIALTHEEIAALPMELFKRASHLLDTMQREAYREAAELLRTHYDAGDLHDD